MQGAAARLVQTHLYLAPPTAGALHAPPGMLVTSLLAVLSLHTLFMVSVIPHLEKT